MSENKAWDRQTKPEEGKPYAWIQWKGTEVCMDVWCECGDWGHLDGDFIYYVKCASCGRVYMTNGHIELVPLVEGEDEPDQCVTFGGDDDE